MPDFLLQVGQCPLPLCGSRVNCILKDGARSRSDHPRKITFESRSADRHTGSAQEILKNFQCPSDAVRVLSFHRWLET